MNDIQFRKGQVGDLPKIRPQKESRMRGKNILITGPPRCGKSTLIEKLIKQITGPLTGFFTREIKREGRRIGFSIITLDGREGILAHEEIKGPHRVGKYGVNLESIERIAVPSIIPSRPEEIVVIDEIGKMECLSPLFRETVTQALHSSSAVIGSIAWRGSSFIEKIKEREDVLLVPVDERNRDSLAGYLLEQIPGK
jgi:nucleoside-triphosphatase